MFGIMSIWRENENMIAYVLFSKAEALLPLLLWHGVVEWVHRRYTSKRDATLPITIETPNVTSTIEEAMRKNKQRSY
jgi:hypothetical protein